MNVTKACRIVNTYSEIKGMQKRRTVTYSAEIVDDGIYLSVCQESESGTLTENCICTSAKFEHITGFLKFISENSIDLGCWYDVLRDMKIQFTVSGELNSAV